MSTSYRAMAYDAHVRISVALFVFGGLAVCALLGCEAAPMSTPTPMPTATAASEPTPTPVPTATHAPTPTSTPVPPTALPSPIPTATPIPTPTATLTPTLDPGQLYMTSACAAIKWMSEAWHEHLFEQAFAFLTALTPPEELQDYHTTLTEMLRFVAREWETTADAYVEAELLDRQVAHVTAAAELSASHTISILHECPSDYVVMLDEGIHWWQLSSGISEPEPVKRLTREEYFNACPDFLWPNLDPEEFSDDVLEATVKNLLHEGSLMAPPAELTEYHSLLVGWLEHSFNRYEAAWQQEQNPDDPDTAAYVAILYQKFETLRLALGQTLRVMDPSLKEALAEHRCLIEG